MAGEGKIESIDDGRFGDNGSIVIVEGSVDLVVAGEGVGGGKFGTWENFPDYVEVLQEKRPSGLPAREFAGVFEVGQVLMIGNDSNRVRSTLDVLPPFREGKDDCEEFSIVDVVVSFSREEGTGEIGAGVKVSVRIALE